MMKRQLPQKNAEQTLAKLFQVLGQTSRLKIVLAIGKGELCVCHLRKILNSRQPYVSQQLMVLRNAGLVQFRREGRNLYYRLTDTRILSLIEQTALMKDIQVPEIDIPEIKGCPAYTVDQLNQASDDHEKELTRVRMKKKVLFLCTGNSCRSQMAEAIVNKQLGDDWQAFSAGTVPAGYVHPKAIQVLAEMGIEHQGSSKLLDIFRDEDFDLVVTVCDSAAENCPLWLGKGKRVHMGFPDPAKASGSEEDILNAFRQVRDDMLRSIPPLCEKANHTAEDIT